MKIRTKSQHPSRYESVAALVPALDSTSIASVMNDVISSGIFGFMSQYSSMFCLECIDITHASVGEILEGGEKVTGRAAPEKTSNRKLENAVPTGKYFGPIYLCYQRFL